MSKSQKGFTLIELVIVITIIAILAALALQGGVEFRWGDERRWEQGTHGWHFARPERRCKKKRPGSGRLFREPSRVPAISSPPCSM
jgi:prepilin-type N-terminal cleavage/methylation domain-containing protein